MTTPSSGTEGELSLTISPYGYIEWRGPRAKLESLCLVPAHIKWPERMAYAHWHAESFEYTLRRCRPDGLHGPMRGFTKRDFWYIRATVPFPAGQLWPIRKAHAELGALLSRAVRSGEAIWIDLPKVHADERVETLSARLIPHGTR
jgi:hypothetical protein